MRLREFLNEGDKSIQDYSHYTDSQLLRESILEEYYAANVYSVMSKYAKDPRVKKVLLHVAEEEKHHVGEFEYILGLLDEEHIPAKEEGEQEAIEEV